MSDDNKLKSIVDSQKGIRVAVRKAIAKAKKLPDTWWILELNNKRGTRQLVIEVMSINGKPLFRLLGKETNNQTHVYEITKRELNIEEWSKS